MKGIIDVYKACILVVVIIIFITGCSQTTQPIISPTPTTPDPNVSNDIKNPLPSNEDKDDKYTFGSLEFTFETVIPGLKNDVLGYPVATAQDKAGHIYILDLYSTGGLVKIFDYQGKYLSQGIPIPSPESRPVDLVVDDDGNVYVADLGLRAVLKYNGNELIEKIYMEEDFYPRSLALDNQGNLFVLSFDRVYKISTEGQTSSFGQEGDGDGEFGAAGSEFYVGPSGIAVNTDDHIFVADTLNCRIQEFDSEGVFVKAYPLDQGLAPQDVAISSNGDINVITSSGLLIRMDSEGSLLSSEDLGISSINGGYLSLTHGLEDVLFAVVRKNIR